MVLDIIGFYFPCGSEQWEVNMPDANSIVVIKLLETNRVIENRIMKALGQEIILKGRRVKDRIEVRLREIVKERIADSPTWKSIVSGDLRGILGVPLTTDLDAILNKLSSEVFISITGSPGTTATGVKIEIFGISGDYAEILSLPQSQFVSTPSRETVPWLEWLLTRGDSIIISDYFVKTALNRTEIKGSRTGMAIMRKSTALTLPQSSNNRSGFAVPTFHAGNLDSNFITRALEFLEPKIALVVRQEFERND